MANGTTKSIRHPLENGNLFTRESLAYHVAAGNQQNSGQDDISLARLGNAGEMRTRLTTRPSTEQDVIRA